jgi:hypothetical protein
MTATKGDRRAYNNLLNLETDERKRELLKRYLEIKEMGDERERDIAFIDFYSRFGDGASSAASTSTPSRTTSLELSRILASAKKIYEYAMNKLTIPSKKNITKVSLKKPIVTKWNSIINSTLLNLNKALADAKKSGDLGKVIEDYITVITKLREGILKKRSTSRMNSIQEGEEEEETSREETSQYASAVHRIIPTAILNLQNPKVRTYLLSIEDPARQQAELDSFLAIVHMTPGTEERNQAFQDFYTARHIQGGKRSHTRKLLHPTVKNIIKPPPAEGV